VARRALSALLSVLVASFVAGAVERTPAGQSGGPRWTGGDDVPALCQVVRPETRVGRPSSPRGGDGAPHDVLVGLLSDARKLSRPPAERAAVADLHAIRAGQPVSTVRSCRGPPA
jgi:hypothetical protein